MGGGGRAFSPGPPNTVILLTRAACGGGYARVKVVGLEYVNQLNSCYHGVMCCRLKTYLHLHFAKILLISLAVPNFTNLIQSLKFKQNIQT